MNKRTTSPAASRRRQRRRKSNIRRFVLILLFLGLCVEITVGALTSPYLNVRDVIVAGNITIPDKQILDMIDLQPETNIFRAKTGDMRDILLQDPVIRTVSLHRKLPCTLVVNVTERQTDLILDSGGSFFEVDAYGIPFRVPKKIDQKVPVISYNLSKKVVPGNQIQDSVFKAAHRTLALSRIDSALNVSKIAVDQSNDLCLNVRDGFEVKIGRPIQLEQKIGIVVKFLNQMPEFRSTGEYIDVTCPDAPAVKYKKS